jgi:hypothetical protein
MSRALATYAVVLPEWRWLAARGWRIVADPAVSSNRCDARNKLIIVRAHVMAKPTSRHRRYVLPHEIGHAVHAETSGYDVSQLAALGLDRRSAVEAVADAYCLARDPSRSMRVWVRASVVWHGRHGYRYRWSHVRSPAARALAARLIYATR